MQNKSPDEVGLLCRNRSCIQTFCLMLLCFMMLAGEASGQGLTVPMGTGSTSVLGGGGGARPPAQLPLLNGTQNVGARRHRTPTGKPCLTVQGYAKPQIINTNIFEHMIIASNDCSKPIKLQVCYYQSQQCIPLDVPAYGRKEVVLGIMPAMDQFQFEYREQFDQGMGGLGGGLN